MAIPSNNLIRTVVGTDDPGICCCLQIASRDIQERFPLNIPMCCVLVNTMNANEQL